MTRQIKVLLKYQPLENGEVFSAHSKRVSVGGEEEDFYSCVEDTVSIKVDDDGFLSLQDGDGFVGFYSDQLDHLKQALDIALAQRDNSDEK